LKFNSIAAFGFVQSLLESRRISRSPLVFWRRSVSDGAFHVHTRQLRRPIKACALLGENGKCEAQENRDRWKNKTATREFSDHGYIGQVGPRNLQEGHTPIISSLA
jgi:hypothetical protein